VESELPTLTLLRIMSGESSVVGVHFWGEHSLAMFFRESGVQELNLKEERFEEWPMLGGGG
jgi:hypothetical protein